MTAYFTASIVGKKYHLAFYLKIIEYIKTHGIEVISDHIIKTNEPDIHLQSKEQRLKFHDQLERWINGCDFMVVEASFPSISVGYEISLAIHRDKPILILYNEGEPPSLFAYHHHEKLVAEKYTEATLGDIIDEFINYARSENDHRFTFFITPQIAAYLEEISRKEKLPKSVYLRKLIEKDMTHHR